MDDIIKHISYDELKKYAEKTDLTINQLTRVKFILSIYEGDSVEKTRRVNGIHTSTAHNWVKKWNEKGIDGII
jgi:transposase